MSFRERLKAAMEAKAFDQKSLAKAAQLSESAVSRHLERDEAPRADSLKKYADALGVSVAWLGYGRSEAPPTAASGGAEDLVGLPALVMVLRDYQWPADADMLDIDIAEGNARIDALTPQGRKRSPSAWRAYLDRAIREGKSERRRARATAG